MIPGGDTGGGPHGEAAARPPFADPRGREGETEDEESITKTHICSIIRCTAAAGDEHAQPEGQEGRVHPEEG